MASEIDCPTCGTLIEITDPTREITCPSCGRVITPEVISRLLEPPAAIPDPYGGSFAQSEPLTPELIDVVSLEGPTDSSGARAYPAPELGNPEVLPPPLPGQPEVLPPPLPGTPRRNTTPWIIGGIIAVILICLACACMSILYLVPWNTVTNF